jgi:hypothetical protein
MNPSTKIISNVVNDYMKLIRGSKTKKSPIVYSELNNKKTIRRVVFRLPVDCFSEVNTLHTHHLPLIIARLEAAGIDVVKVYTTECFMYWSETFTLLKIRYKV